MSNCVTHLGPARCSAARSDPGRVVARTVVDGLEEHGMAWDESGRRRVGGARNQTQGVRAVPLNDRLAFLGMCLLSALAYGLACWLGHLV